MTCPHRFPVKALKSLTAADIIEQRNELISEAMPYLEVEIPKMHKYMLLNRDTKLSDVLEYFPDKIFIRNMAVRTVPECSCPQDPKFVIRRTPVNLKPDSGAKGSNLVFKFMPDGSLEIRKNDATQFSDLEANQTVRLFVNGKLSDRTSNTVTVTKI